MDAVVLFTCSSGVCKRRDGFIDGNVGTSLRNALDLSQIFEDEFGVDFGNFREGGDRSLHHVVVFAFQKLDEIPSIRCDEIRVDPADLVHDVHTVAMDVLVVVPQVFGDLANTRLVVTRGKVTRQVEIGRSVTTGLQITKTV